MEQQDLSCLDIHSLTLLLASLSQICADKAKAVQTEWSDKDLTTFWTKVSNDLDNLVLKYRGII